MRQAAFALKGGALPQVVHSYLHLPLRRPAMYEKPEITKHDDLSQITFSSH
jgi:hypothetical protein